MTMEYTSYGLSIRSEIALPELRVRPHTQDLDIPDVQIRIGQIARKKTQDSKQLGPFLWVSPDMLWLEVPRIARFVVRKGCEIVIEPAAGIDEDSIRVFLMGSALGALLFQRGLLVLHGNAIRIGNQCLVCVGQSGAGKSTLAASLMQRGFEILADDVVPVDRECRAIPGFPRIKLWRDTLDRLQIDTNSLRRIRPEMEKFNYPLVHQFADQPLPIRWVYILNSHNRDDTDICPINGMLRFEPLYNHTYRVRFLDGLALKAQHLQLCGQLANRIHLARITRPEKGFDLDGLVDRILADVAENQ